MSLGSYNELQNMTEKELVDRYDKIQIDYRITPDMILRELYKRLQDKQSAAMENYASRMDQYTMQIIKMTKIVTGATIINLVITVLLMFKR